MKADVVVDERSDSEDERDNAEVCDTEKGRGGDRERGRRGELLIRPVHLPFSLSPFLPLFRYPDRGSTTKRISAPSIELQSDSRNPIAKNKPAITGRRS
jgi:hypothetical protein